MTPSALLSLAALASPVQSVPANAADAKPLAAGVMAPAVKLTGLDGKSMSLKSLTGGKPTILVFYRGGWCPFCNTQLSALGQSQAELKKLGWQVIGVSPDTAAKLKETVAKNQLSYRLVSDSSAAAMKAFGVAFRVDDATYGKYKSSYGMDLEAYSGAEHHILPVPSVFLIGRDGKIKFVYSNPDYRVRLKTSDLLAAAKKHSG